MAHEKKLKAPKAFEFPMKLKIVFILMIVVGIGTFLGGQFLWGQGHAAWNGYLIGFYFTFSLAVGGPFILSTQHLTQAAWSMPIRRLFESTGRFLIPSFILFLGIVLAGGKHLYTWWDFDYVLADPILAKKSAWFIFSNFLIVTVGGFVTMIVAFLLLKRESIRQDQEKSERSSLMSQVYSVFYLLSFIFTFSVLAWYLIMGLDPHWFSTMFSVYTFAGMFQASLAFAVIMLLWLMDKGTFGDYAGERQVHDLGQLLFGFTVFYAYIAFCQYLLIWYANIPEEATWYLARGYVVDTTTGWEIFTAVLPAFKFILPFFVMLPQMHKKNKFNILRMVAFGLIFLQFYETWYWVAPTTHDAELFAALPSMLHMAIEWGVGIGFVGLFLYVVFDGLTEESIVPINDPYLREGTKGHHHGVKAPKPSKMVISK